MKSIATEQRRARSFQVELGGAHRQIGRQRRVFQVADARRGSARRPRSIGHRSHADVRFPQVSALIAWWIGLRDLGAAERPPPPNASGRREAAPWTRNGAHQHPHGDGERRGEAGPATADSPTTRPPGRGLAFVKATKEFAIPSAWWSENVVLPAPCWRLSAQLGRYLGPFAKALYG